MVNHNHTHQTEERKCELVVNKWTQRVMSNILAGLEYESYNNKIYISVFGYITWSMGHPVVTLHIVVLDSAHHQPDLSQY